jgi:hypothetical protein
MGLFRKTRRLLRPLPDPVASSEGGRLNAAPPSVLPAPVRQKNDASLHRSPPPPRPSRKVAFILPRGSPSSDNGTSFIALKWGGLCIPSIARPREMVILKYTEQTMSALLASIITVVLVLGLAGFDAAAEQEPAEDPAELSPFEPPLVREGDFAVKLAEVLELGEIGDEQEAGRLLAEIGLSPRNGWISDYPVTPVVLAEVRQAVADSAEAGKLSMTPAEALEEFDRLASELGLSVDEDAGPPADSLPPEEAPYAGAPGTGGYPADDLPVMTYYPPPSYYYDYYDWVPYPFYFSRSYFPGFFILHDFHRVHKFNHHFHRKHKHQHFAFHDRFKRKFISNHDWKREIGRTHLRGSHGAERAASIDLERGRRVGFENPAQQDRRLAAPSMTDRGGRTSSFSGDRRRAFPESLRSPGRFENRVPDRRFSIERREFGPSRLRGGQGAAIRSSPHFRRERSDSFRPSGTFPRGSESSPRSFGSGGRDGRRGDAFRPFQTQGRSFSGPGGTSGRGRR